MDDETRDEEYGRLRRELSEYHYDTPEYRMIMDRIAVLTRERAVERARKLREQQQNS